MNTIKFNEASDAYKSGDFARALHTFTQTLQDANEVPQPGEIGLIYHRIGNCLVKLGDYNEAVHAFSQATADTAYAEIGTVNYNLGTAYAVLKDYQNAVRFFEVAASDGRYATPYKAYMGMGNALLRMGKSAEAGAAFRSAALDNGNPDPSKALLNLGICFMALNRPADAVISYESALQFDMQPMTKNKLYANLGQAYVANNQFQQAIYAFENALKDKTYYLNDAASVDYQQAIALVSTGTAAMRAVKLDQSQPMSAATPQSQPMTRVPSQSQPMSRMPSQSQPMAQVQGQARDISGIDVPASDSPEYQQAVAQDAMYDPYATGSQGYADVAQGYADGMQGYPGAAQQSYAGATGSVPVQGPATPAEEKFFSASDEELEAWSKSESKKKKKHGKGFVFGIIFLVLLIAALGGGIFAYVSGYGFPTAESVATSVIANPSDSSLYASNVSEDTIKNTADFVTANSNATVNGVDRSMTQSTVYVTVPTSKNGSVQYQVDLTRDLIGWKVSDVELYFPSQH